VDHIFLILIVPAHIWDLECYVRFVIELTLNFKYKKNGLYIPCRHRGGGGNFQSYLTLALEGSEWSAWLVLNQDAR